jgi:hypothetical protein
MILVAGNVWERCELLKTVEEHRQSKLDRKNIPLLFIIVCYYGSFVPNLPCGG